MQIRVRKSFLSSLCVMLAFGVTFAQGNGVGKRVGPQQSTRGVTVDDYLANQADLHAWLIGQTPASVLSDPIAVQLTEAELDDVDRVDPAGRGPLRVGLVKQLAESITVHCENTGRGQRRATCSGDGVFQMTRDGGFVWARAVSSPGAYGIRVHVNEFNLPADADLYFYSLDGEAYGPFQKSGPNDDGDFWLPSIMSDTGILLVRHFGPGARAELSEVTMRITEIGHIGKSFAGGDLPTTRAGSDLCGYNASCVQNATCHGPTLDAEKAAAKMLWIAGCCIYICSGGLIADTDTTSEIPYFLTANHCLSSNRAARNLEAFFQYQMGCNNACPAGSYDPAPAPKTTGASVVSTSRTGDYTLLRLNEAPPSGSVYLGWNSSPVAFSSGTALQRISHPSGAPQAYSAHAVDTNIGTCLNTPRGEFIYSDDVEGATEGGSSGSPVVNAAGEIVGQLTGCCPAGGGNCSDVCNSNNHTIDGALAFYFPEVEQYLDPSGSECTLTEVSCSDGVDNDCDGATDCDDSNGDEDCSADPACDGGGGCVNPGGDPPGASCSSDGDCCSNKCKGPPSNKTCR